MLLKIRIKPFDVWDEAQKKFISFDKETELTLGHSLVSISKWEAKWKKPYLANREMSTEEVLDYIKCMTITQNVDPKIYYGLSQENIQDIKKYIEDDMTATTFTDRRSAQQHYRNKVTTSEEIYYMMSENNIPVEFQKWHLNRLLTLLKVCYFKNTPPKKMSKKDIISDYAAINRANRAKFHTKG